MSSKGIRSEDQGDQGPDVIFLLSEHIFFDRVATLELPRLAAVLCGGFARLGGAGLFARGRFGFYRFEWRARRPVEPGAFNLSAGGNRRDAELVVVELACENLDRQFTHVVMVLPYSRHGSIFFVFLQKEINEGDAFGNFEPHFVEAGLDKGPLAYDDFGPVSFIPSFELSGISHDIASGLSHPFVRAFDLRKEVDGDSFFGRMECV